MGLFRRLLAACVDASEVPLSAIDDAESGVAPSADSGRSRIRIEADDEPRTVVLEPDGQAFEVAAGDFLTLDVATEDTVEMIVIASSQYLTFWVRMSDLERAYIYDSRGERLY